MPFSELSALFSENAPFVEAMYALYQQNATTLPTAWKKFFDTLEYTPKASGGCAEDMYRTHGHCIARLDPLDLPSRHTLPLPAFQSPPDTPFQTAYSGTIGAEFMHLFHQEEVVWIQNAMEDRSPALSTAQRIDILKHLIAASSFERFLSVRYVAMKRFGLEGCDSLIPALHHILDCAAQANISHGFIGMAHRGRLNVMAHIIGLPYEEIFSLFSDGPYIAPTQTGDVKYHLGALRKRVFGKASMWLNLSPNSSHLESVNPIVLGHLYAAQKKIPPHQTIGILMHGDAAFSGQGIVTETLGLAQVSGYATGGTIHIVINNQIGFTAHSSQNRSSPYSTDWAKAIGAPVFHVNADDPDAVVRVAKTAYRFWRRFRKDVVIDLIGYRRNGHNETDEPSFTQPRMYEKIAQHLPVQKIYEARLIEQGCISTEAVQELYQAQHQCFEEAIVALERTIKKIPPTTPPAIQYAQPVTGISKLEVLGKALAQIPSGFNLNPKLNRLLKNRKAMACGEAPVNWAMAESLAFASLLAEKYPIRLSGQDSGRGTFTQRHSIWVDTTTDQTYIPLNHLGCPQAPIEILNSPLSEAAILGFEWGYSVATPEGLTIWEAQFGDFANNAQAIIDQYIASAETKWNQRSGLVLLLPHGYEGQGAEHSSARIERYLQLCAQDNLQVVNCTTPANYFHCLRRQIHQGRQRPLILFTPKSLLRHPQAISSLEDMGAGTTFLPVLPDPMPIQNSSRIVLCSGKIFYDLLQERENRKESTVTLIRLEQLYPLPLEALQQVLKPAEGAPVFWCQEEPANAGAWTFIRHHLEGLLGHPIFYIGRPEAAAPATGCHKRHTAEQKELMDQALTLDP